MRRKVSPHLVRLRLIAGESAIVIAGIRTHGDPAGGLDGRGFEANGFAKIDPLPACLAREESGNGEGAIGVVEAFGGRAHASPAALTVPVMNPPPRTVRPSGDA
jgi:hypothetical protein